MAEEHPIVDSSAIETGLAALGVPATQVAAALGLVPADSLALLVYGSRAREDHTPESDLDLLALVPTSRGSLTAAAVHLSCYTPGELSSATGTLFGMHLARDAITLTDPQGVLDGLLSRMGTPDPDDLRQRVRHFGAVLDVHGEERERYLSGLSRLARYFLRTVIYAEAIEDGRPCFSVRELAVRYEHPEWVALLSADPDIHGPATEHGLADLCERLVAIVGALETNPHGSVRALVVAEWNRDRPLATLGVLATSNDGGPFDYSELPKVLL